MNTKILMESDCRFFKLKSYSLAEDKDKIVCGFVFVFYFLIFLNQLPLYYRGMDLNPFRWIHYPWVLAYYILVVVDSQNRWSQLLHSIVFPYHHYHCNGLI